MQIQKATRFATEYTIFFHSTEAANAFAEEASAQRHAVGVTATGTKVYFIVFDMDQGVKWAHDFEARWIEKKAAETALKLKQSEVEAHTATETSSKPVSEPHTDDTSVELAQ